MNRKKIIAILLSTITTTNLVFNVSNIVYASETIQVIKEENTINISDKKVQGRRIFVKTLAGVVGDGSEERPFTDFKTAYEFAKDNDTIVVMNAVTIGNDDNSSDKGVFTLNKAITIEGSSDGNGSLTSRVPIQLESNVKFENIEFVSEKIYLNGHALEMKDVRENKSNHKKPIVYGGSYNNSNANKGVRSTLKVDGSTQNPIVFKEIYAGSETGESNINVKLDLIDGVKVEGAIDASGNTGKVNGNVEFNIGSINAIRFENTHNSPNTEIIFNSYNQTGGSILKGFNNVTLKKSIIEVKDTNEFTNISGNLKIDNQSKLDISKIDRKFSVNNLSADKGSIVVLNKDTGLLEVGNNLSGEIELRTPGNDVATSGVVELNRAYVTANKASTGTVTFKPFTTQKNIELKEEVVGETKNWIIKEKQIDNSIGKLEILEDKRINVEQETNEFSLKYSDGNGNPLQYKPEFEAILKDPKGNMLSEDQVAIDYDPINDHIYVYIYDNTLKVGNYKLVVSEKVSGKAFEFSMDVYKASEDPRQVVKDVKDSLLNVEYYGNEVMADLLSRHFFSAEKMEKKQEIAKRDNIPLHKVSDEMVDKELKMDNLHIMSYGEAFAKVKDNIEDVIYNVVKNSQVDQSYTGDYNTYFVNKIKDNKEKLLLGLSYIYRLYDFNIGNVNLKDILIENPDMYGKNVNSLDWIISIGDAGGSKLKISNNPELYTSLFKNVISDEDSLISFLEYNVGKFAPNVKMDQWFIETSKAIIVEKESNENPDAITSVYSKLKSGYKAHILPLLTLSNNSVYVISNSSTVTYGLVDVYVDRTLQKTDINLYNKKIEEFKEKVEKVASEQRDYIDFLYRIAKPQQRKLLATNERLVIDTLALYKDGEPDAQGTWSPKFGDSASTGVKEFMSPLDLYQPFFRAHGQAEGLNTRFYLAKALEADGLSTYTHELTHHLDSNLLLNDNGRRDGVGGEFYPRGLFESYELDEAVFNFNFIYDKKGKNVFTNSSPERFQTDKDLKEYMNGILDVVYTLDYAEANVVLKKNDSDKVKWYHKLGQKADTTQRRNKGDGSVHMVDTISKISMEEAKNLNSIDDLIDNNIIASRYEIEGLKTTGVSRYNDYNVIPLFTSNYSAVQNNKGVSGDLIMKRQAYEILAEYGYYEGLVPYISNQYKKDAVAEGKVLSDDYILEKIFNGDYTSMVDFKKAKFKERIDKKDQLKPVTIHWNNQQVTIDTFNKLNELMEEAINSDLKNVQELPSGWNNIRAQNTQVEKLKQEIFKAYLKDSNEFKDSIYVENAQVKDYTVVFDKNAVDATGTMDEQILQMDNEQALNQNGFTRKGYKFAGWKDQNGKHYDDGALVNNLVNAAGEKITLYAQWTPIEYQVHFNKNNENATGSMDNQNMIYDTENNLNKNAFELKGYTFAGWSTTANGQVKYKDGEVISNLTENDNSVIELYAVWLKNQEVINSVPTIDAKDVELTVGEAFDPLKNVTAYDKEDKEIIITKDNVIFNNVNPNVAGKYKVTYKVTDSNGASVEKTIVVTVNEKMASINSVPTIDAKDVELTVGEAFDPLKNVTAYDKEDKEIIITKDNVIFNNVNPNVAGKYKVTYKVTDSNGASVEKTIVVTVVDKDNGDISETPENPQKPQNPETPQKPENPQNPEKPAKPENGKPSIPQTGDSSTAFPILAAISSLVLGKLSYRRKKKK